jgi:hypothetical protein
LEIGFGHLLGGGFGFADAAGFGEGFEAEVAALLGPFVVLFGQDGADEANDAVAVGEDADDVGAAADLSVEALVRVIGPDLLPDLFREGGEREDLVAGGLEVFEARGSLCSRASRTRSNWALTDSLSGWSNTVCSSVFTHGHELFGVTDIRFAA